LERFFGRTGLCPFAKGMPTAQKLAPQSVSHSPSATFQPKAFPSAGRCALFMFLLIDGLLPMEIFSFSFSFCQTDSFGKNQVKRCWPSAVAGPRDFR